MKPRSHVPPFQRLSWWTPPPAHKGLPGHRWRCRYEIRGVGQPVGPRCPRLRASVSTFVETDGTGVEDGLRRAAAASGSRTVGEPGVRALRAHLVDEVRVSAGRAER